MLCFALSENYTPLNANDPHHPVGSSSFYPSCSHLNTKHTPRDSACSKRQ
nr:MAG TPA: hypothetical protein [Caudoviricetes sp.]